MDQFFTQRAAFSLKRMAFAFLFLTTAFWVQAQKTWDGGAGTSNWGDANNWNNNTVPLATETVTLGNTNVTVNGNFTCAGLTLNNSSSGATNTITIGTNTLTITGALTYNVTGSTSTKAVISISTGTLNAGSVSITANASRGSITFSGAGALNITNGDMGNGLNFTASTSTTTYNRNGSQNVGAYTYNNLVFSTGASASTKTLTGTTTANGSVSIAGTTTLDVSSNNYGLTVGGSWTKIGTFNARSGTVTFNATGAGTQQSIDASNFYNLSFSGSRTKVAVGALTIANDVNIGSNSNFTAGNFTHTVGDDWIKSSSASFTPNNSTIHFNGNNGSGNTQDISACQFFNITFSNNSPKEPVDDAVLDINGDVLINAGATLIGGDNDDFITHTVAGNWTNNGTFTHGNSCAISFDGAAPQTIGGNNSTIFYRLTMNNSNGGVTVNTTAIIANGATFTNGIMNTSSSALLSFLSGSTVTGAKNSSHVNGPVQKAGTTAFTFPIGSASKYVPMSIGAAAASNTFIAQYFPSNARLLGPVSDPNIQVVSACEYWTLNRTSGSSDVNLNLFWSADNACSGYQYTGNPPFSLAIAQFENTSGSGSWDASSYGPSNDITSSSPYTSGSVSWASGSAIPKFQGNNINYPFTFASSDQAQSPLPVTIMSFEGRKVAAGTQLSWKVAGESHTTGYDIERRPANGAFSKIGFVPATGAGSYSFTDAPQQGVVQYRLRNVEQDSRSSYSIILTFQNGKGTILFQVLPTLVTSRTSVQHAAAGSSALLRLSAADGKQVKLQKPQAGSIKTEVDMTNLRPGIYLLYFNDGNGSVQTVKLLKQ